MKKPKVPVKNVKGECICCCPVCGDGWIMRPDGTENKELLENLIKNPISVLAITFGGDVVCPTCQKQ